MALEGSVETTVVIMNNMSNMRALVSRIFPYFVLVACL